jgi:hypothetical protein
MHRGAESKLPAMIVAVGFPSHGKGGAQCAVTIQLRQAVVDEPARDSVWTLPGVACCLNVERAAVMRTRARHGGEGRGEAQSTNCKAP